MIRTAAAALAATFLLAAPAFAAPASSVHVSLAGKSPAQVHTEIVKAASTVCYEQHRFDPLFSNLYTACIAQSVEAAVAQIGDSKLLAYSQAHPVRLASR